MVTQENQTNVQSAKVESAIAKPARKSFMAVIKEPKFYPELTLEKKKDLFIGVPLLIFDATIRDWEGEFGSKQYCLFKVAINEPGKENECFLFELGGNAIVSKVKSAKAKRALPSREGLTAVIGQQDNKDGQPYYCFVDLA